jgi:hypothetical protein
MTEQDVRNKFAELKHKGLKPSMLHIALVEGSQTVKNAQIWHEHQTLWSFPQGYDSGLGKASGDVPWRNSLDLSYSESDQWRVKPAFYPI